MSDQASRMAMDTGAAARHGGGWARRAWDVVPASGMADRLALLTAAAPINGVASAQGTAAASLSALMAVPARRETDRIVAELEHWAVACSARNMPCYPSYYASSFEPEPGMARTL